MLMYIDSVIDSLECEIQKNFEFSFVCELISDFCCTFIIFLVDSIF